MTNTKTTKRSLFSSVVALLLCFSMLLGTTYAWFTDSATSGVNTIVAGNLDVVLSYSTWDAVNNKWNDYALVDEDELVFNENALWEPGYTEVVKFKVENKGTLALQYSMSAMVYSEVKGTNVAGESYALSDYIYAGRINDSNIVNATPGTMLTNAMVVPAATTQLGSGFVLATDVEMMGMGEDPNNPIDTDEFVMVLTMPTNVNNVANPQFGKEPEIKLGVSLVATQFEYESDDFSKDYDKDATYPTIISVSKAVERDNNGVSTENVVLTHDDSTSMISKVSVTVPAGTALEEGTDQLVLQIVERAEADSNILISSAQSATTYDISIEGVDDNNGTDIEVTLYIETGLTDVELYHKTTEIPCHYDSNSGKLTFTTKNFSPFTVVHKKVNNGDVDTDDTFYVDTQAKLETAVKTVTSGDTISLAAGTYKLPNIQNKNIVLIGAGPETIVDYSHMGNYQEVSGSSFVFKNMTIKCAEVGWQQNQPYPGLQHTTSVSYEDCHILGTANLFSATTFKNCTFDSRSGEHNVVTYGSDSVTFENCEFTYADRAVNCYAENASARDVEITFTDCSFTKVAGKGVTGAIETNGMYTNSLTLNINNCTVNEGDLWWVSTYDTTNGAKTRVYMDGKLTVNTAEHLQALANAQTAGEITIVLGRDITGDITVSQKEGVNIVIDGANYKYDGTIFIDGKARFTGVETLTIKNINFETAKDGVDFISSNIAKQYAHNVTIDSCTFTNKGSGTVVPARFRQAYNITMKNCTIKDTFSPMWTTGVQGLTITNVTANCAKEGITIGASNNVLIEKCIITVPGENSFGIRTDATDNYKLTVNNCELTVEKPIVIRGFSNTYMVIVDGENYAGTTVSTTAELINAIKNAPIGETTYIGLADGTYDGNIDITVAALGKSGGDVVIKAMKGATPVITGTVTLGYRNQGVGSTMYNANVTFEGITFDHTDVAHSLDIQDVKSLTLNNCTVIGESEYGIVCARGNGTGPSKIVGCTFENAGLQLLGNYATGLVIDDCDFNDSCINVQAGNGVTVQNCRFDNTLTGAHINEGFYAIRSNSTPIKVKNCEIHIDSELTTVATEQTKWYLLANRGTTNWTVEDVAVTMSDAALMQTELAVTACTSTGSINTTNLTVNGVAYPTAP